MTARTPEEAQEWLCPSARTFAAPKAEPHCQGPSCAAWRWQPISASDPRFVRAVKAIIATGKTHKEAVSIVSSDMAGHGVPTAPERGFCGLGGAL